MRKTIGILMAAAALVALSACSSDDDGDVASTDASAAASSTTEAESTATTRASTGTTEATADGGSGTTLAGDSASSVDRSEWTSVAAQYRGEDGRRYTYACPAGGTANTVWGTDVYTDDSSVCTAAVHAGKITFGAGGTVEIEIRPGLDAYEGSTRNGVATQPYGQWSGSFVIVS